MMDLLRNILPPNYGITYGDDVYCIHKIGQDTDFPLLRGETYAGDILFYMKVENNILYIISPVGRWEYDLNDPETDLEKIIKSHA